MFLSLCSIVSEVIPSCSNEYCQKEPVVAQRVLFYRKNATIMPNEMNGTRAKPSLLLRFLFLL